MLQNVFAPRQGTRRGRQPAHVLLSRASGRIFAQTPRPTVIPLEPDIRQLLPAQLNCSQAHRSQGKFGGGEVQHSCVHSWGITAMQKTTSLHGKAPRRKKSCAHQGTSPSKLPNAWDAQSCCHLPAQPLTQTVRGSSAG